MCSMALVRTQFLKINVNSVNNFYRRYITKNNVARSKPCKTEIQKSVKNKVAHINPKYNWKKFILAFATFSGAGTVFYFSRPPKERRFLRVTVGGIGRFFRSSFTGTKISLNYMWNTFGVSEDHPKYAELWSKAHTEAAKLILDACLRNGGLYVKLGQGLVIMDHILPREYIDTLRVLQDKCLIRDPAESHILFIEEFGKPIEEVFQTFDSKPIAAASLAQVFKGTTKDGQTVAIKCQYLDLKDRFVGDIATLTILLKIAGWFHPDFDFAWVLNELKGTLEQELNFLNEAKNSEQCSKELKNLPFIYIPKVVWNLTTSRIMTSEWIDGIKISHAVQLKEAGFSLSDIDYKLFKAFAEQIFHTGFVHADPHPGNILVRKGADKKAQLVLLDHGLYEVVPDGVRESLRKLWKVMVLNDHEGMKKYAMELGVAEKDYRIFCIALGQRYIPSADPKEADEDIIRLFFARQTSPIKRKGLTKKDRMRIENQILLLRQRCLNIFRSIPSKLMLVTRNINAIRSIAKGHGDPINRYKVMARCATQGTYTPPGDVSRFRRVISQLKERIHFEIQLWWGGVKMWFASSLIRSFELIGLQMPIVPD